MQILKTKKALFIAIAIMIGVFAIKYSFIVEYFFIRPENYSYEFIEAKKLSINESLLLAEIHFKYSDGGDNIYISSNIYKYIKNNIYINAPSASFGKIEVFDKLYYSYLNMENNSSDITQNEYQNIREKYFRK